MDEIALEFADVTSGYGPITVLNGFSAGIRGGCVTTLIGANGAGKSTVFKTLFGLARLRSGEIRLFGGAITRLRAKDLIRMGLAYAPQGRNLFPSLSVEENLELGGVALSGAVRRVRMEQVWQRYPQIARLRPRQASTLSGGEQKLLEIARALLLQPRVLLVDEPSIGLAPKSASELFAHLRALAQTGMTVLMVEQNVRSALAMSDHAIALEAGRAALQAPATEILSHPRIRSVFLGGHVEEAPHGG